VERYYLVDFVNDLCFVQMQFLSFLTVRFFIRHISRFFTFTAIETRFLANTNYIFEWHCFYKIRVNFRHDGHGISI